MNEFHLLYHVKYFTVIQLIIYCSLFQPANAQNENWDTYMAKFGDKPGSVLVDMGLINGAPDKRYPYLVITGPQAHNCNQQGLPDKEEIDVQEEILDATNNFITGVTAKVLTGTFTYNCERLNYYYVKDTMNIRNAIMRLYNRTYKNYSYAINIKSDPEWSTYRTFLYPSEATLNWMENNKIIIKMIQHGDSLNTLRNIDFDLYFKTDSCRKAFAEFARSKRYKTNELPEAKNPNAPFEIIVSTYNYIKMDVINSITEELKKEAKMHHGLYNGWVAK